MLASHTFVRWRAPTTSVATPHPHPAAQMSLEVRQLPINVFSLLFFRQARITCIVPTSLFSQGCALCGWHSTFGHDSNWRANTIASWPGEGTTSQDVGVQDRADVCR